MTLNRRKFVNSLLGFEGTGSLLTTILPVLSFLKPSKSPKLEVNLLKAGLASEFPSNSSKVVKLGQKPVLLIKSEKGDFIALSATCTHLNCIVHYKKDAGEIECACHRGKYDLKGNNVSGPPQKALDSYIVNLVNDEIIITNKAGQNI